MVEISVGAPFPMAIPAADGAVFEIGPDGDMNLIIRMDGQSPSEAAALKEGFNRYSLYVGEALVWVFKFPAPVGYLDAPFHAGLYSDGRVERFLAHDDWNALNVYVVDRGITQIVRLSGLRPDAMALVRETVRQQGAISRVEYDGVINRLYQKTPEELFRYGRVFRHGEG